MSEHCEVGKGYVLSFWIGNTAATRENADRCCIHQYPSGMRILSFEWPRDSFVVENLRRLLASVFEAGQKDGKRQVREALEIEEPRRG